jgi:hypothetical protein
LERGITICLPDLRGVGETSVGSTFGPRSNATTISCRDQVLGETILGARLRDLRSVLKFLRTRGELDKQIALWGDSLAAVNPPEQSEAVPFGIDNPNVQAEPSAGLLVLLCALWEESVRAVYCRGTFASFRSLLDSQFLYVPHDAAVPGALTVGDVTDIAAVLVPRPVRVEHAVNGLNRELPAGELIAAFAPAEESYRSAGLNDRLSLGADRDASPAAWLVNQTRGASK